MTESAERLDLDVLERLAKAAGADSGLGTWDAADCVVWFPDGDSAVEVGYSKPRPVGVTFANIGAWPDAIDESAVAGFIAAACPDAILALIARVRELERDAERLTWLIDEEAIVVSIVPAGGLPRYHVEWPHLYEEQAEYFADPRAAIDAAAEAPNAEEQP